MLFNNLLELVFKYQLAIRYANSQRVDRQTLDWKAIVFTNYEEFKFFNSKAGMSWNLLECPKFVSSWPTLPRAYEINVNIVLNSLYLYQNSSIFFFFQSTTIFGNWPTLKKPSTYWATLPPFFCFYSRKQYSAINYWYFQHLQSIKDKLSNWF